MFRNEAAESLVAAALAAKANNALVEEVQAIYRAAGAAIARRAPTCWQSGRCCHFQKMGHNLFVSTAEAACFLRFTSPRRLDGIAIGGSCPFLREDPARCSARRARPLGCRLFFCDPSAQWWQHGLYNELHSRLRRLHEQLKVPYLYAEWLTVLRAVQQAVPGAPTGEHAG